MKLPTKAGITYIAMSLLFFSCSKTNDTTNNVNDTDRNFVLQASLANTEEVGAGGLASTKGNDPMVMSFGQMMVSDHTTAQADLKTTGTAAGITVKDTVDAMHVTLMQTLQGLSGREFDSTYIMNQITDHQKTVSDFQTELSSGSRSQVKDFANKYLPKIQMHLKLADSIATVMKFK